MNAATSPADGWPALPLFPLATVLFPQGLLQLKVFEARYLDLISDCMRSLSPFGVVCLSQGSEVRGGSDEATRFEQVGVLAQLQEVDAEQPGLLRVRCIGSDRVLLSAPQQRDDGLWLAQARRVAADAEVAVPAELAACALALGQAISALEARKQHPFLPPHRLSDAGWVANRWCEILPIPLAAKQRLLVLDEPLVRLKLVDEYLRSKGVL